MTSSKNFQSLIEMLFYTWFFTVLGTSFFVSVIRFMHLPAVGFLDVVQDVKLWPTMVLLVWLVPKAIGFSFEANKRADETLYEPYQNAKQLNDYACFSVLSWLIGTVIIFVAIAIHWALDASCSKVMLGVGSFVLHFIAISAVWTLHNNPCDKVQLKKEK